jgi:hypothetical protein
LDRRHIRKEESFSSRSHQQLDEHYQDDGLKYSFRYPSSPVGAGDSYPKENEIFHEGENFFHIVVEDDFYGSYDRNDYCDFFQATDLRDCYC